MGAAHQAMDLHKETMRLLAAGVGVQRSLRHGERGVHLPKVHMRQD